jgi:hypothetical protein
MLTAMTLLAGGALLGAGLQGFGLLIKSTAFFGAGLSVSGAATAATVWFMTGKIRVPRLPSINSQQRYSGLAYRSASGTANSVTPRPGIDDMPGGGLSAYDSLENPGVKPGKYVVIDTSRLRSLYAIADELPPGHITIRPSTDLQLQDWASSRNTGTVHPLTKEILDAVIDIAKKK